MLNVIALALLPAVILLFYTMRYSCWWLNTVHGHIVTQISVDDIRENLQFRCPFTNHTNCGHKIFILEIIRQSSNKSFLPCLGERHRHFSFQHHSIGFGITVNRAADNV